tara:strand:- start:567 stop:971 length:405 start_codon:yes stop_codon:yes gene_type:complete
MSRTSFSIYYVLLNNVNRLNTTTLSKKIKDHLNNLFQPSKKKSYTAVIDNPILNIKSFKNNKKYLEIRFSLLNTVIVSYRSAVISLNKLENIINNPKIKVNTPIIDYANPNENIRKLWENNIKVLLKLSIPRCK